MASIIDYLIVVALDEEVDYIGRIIEAITGHPLKFEQDGRLYSRELVTTRTGDATVVILAVGRMGEAPVQSAVEDAIRHWQPADMILVGIAGSLEPDSLMVGDVIVPSRVFGYSESKVVEEKVDGGYRNTVQYRKTGDRATSSLVETVRALWLNSGTKEAWKKACRDAAAADSTIAARMDQLDAEREKPTLHCAANNNIASGNEVVASRQRGKELQVVLDVTVNAVEMESKGLFEAVARFDQAPRTLVVRGISDYADRHKSRAEKKFKDGWRRFAVQNATRLVMMLIQERPSLNRNYQPQPAPVLTAGPDDRSPERAHGAGVQATEAGGITLAFLPFLSASQGRAETTLTFEAVGQDGASAHFEHLVFRDTRDERIRLRFKGKNAETCTLERSALPSSHDLFVALPAAASGLRVTLTDEFGRQAHYSWP